MPGPVSDSFDPEFGTGSNANDLRDAIIDVRKRITYAIGSEELKNIIEVVHGKEGKRCKVPLMCEQQLRIIRFCLDRAMESI